MPEPQNPGKLLHPVRLDQKKTDVEASESVQGADVWEEKNQGTSN